MSIAFLVVKDSATLYRLCGDVLVDHDLALRVRLSGVDREFQGIEQGAGVTIGHVDQVIERGLLKAYLELTVAALAISERLRRNGSQVSFRKWLELEDAAPADQSLVDLEVRVLRGRPDECHRAVLDPR